jgi:large subunit ribosomal protein L19
VSQELLHKAVESCLKTDVPEFSVGDTVRVNVRIVEGEKERIQAFSGTVIRRSHGGISETFTVRRIVNNEGVERIFPIHSPRVAGVDVIRRGHVRRAKLHYLRNRIGKATRVRDLKPEAQARERAKAKAAKQAAQAQADANAKAQADTEAATGDAS